MKDKISQKIKDTIEKNKMINAGDSVVIGVSGGADSMALLKFFIDNKDFYKINIIAAHVNHCLRGWESDRDENFVREFCIKNDVDHRVLRVDVKEIARENRIGTEECARNLRYKFFCDLANEFKAKIATAHTLSDNVETIILNLSRGTGPKGLGGIPITRGNIIRPIIFLKREETEIFCRENNINFMIDSTNLSRDYSRNRVRLDVIPVLKSLNLALENSVGRLIFMQGQDNIFFDEKVELLLEKFKYAEDSYSLKDIRKLPYSLKSRFILRAAQKFSGKDLEFNHVNLILEKIDKGRGSVNFSEDSYVGVSDGNLIFYHLEKNNENIEEKVLPIREMQVNGRRIVFRVIDKKKYDQELKVNNLLFINAIDYDTINNGTVIRNRRSGDKFCKFGRNVTKTIKKLFNEEKIPVAYRDKILMLANNSTVLWIEGQGVSSEAAVKESTRRVILIFREEINDAQ